MDGGYEGLLGVDEGEAAGEIVGQDIECCRLRNSAYLYVVFWLYNELYPHYATRAAFCDDFMFYSGTPRG